MQIKYTKIILDNQEAYKYQPIKYCCHKMWKELKNTENGAFYLGIPSKEPDIHSQEFPIPGIMIRKTNTEEEISYCPYCGRKIQNLVTKEIDLSKSYRNLFRLKKRAARRTDRFNERYNMKEYISRILDSMIFLEEMDNYTEQIERLKEETKSLQKMYKQLDGHAPAYLEYLSDIIRANKIMINYLSVVNLHASEETPRQRRRSSCKA